MVQLGDIVTCYVSMMVTVPFEICLITNHSNLLKN